MPSRSMLCAVVAGLAIIGSAHAEPAGRSDPPPAAEQAAAGRVRVPGTRYEVDLGLLRSQPGAALGSDALLRAIIAWLSSRFDLPSTDTLPALKIASGAEIAMLRHAGELSDRPRDVTPAPADSEEVVALYDAQTRTIYLREGWSGSTPDGLSVLVHEMVHHLQRSARIAYACDEEREQLAFAAQDEWLHLFGHQLTADFDLDPFTIMLRSTCLYY